MSALDNFFSGMTELINKYRESAGESADKVSSADAPKTETKEEVKEEVKEVKTEIDPRDARIKELTELLAQKDAIITQNNEQINALKDLTSVNNPINETELSLEELIIKGEF